MTLGDNNTDVEAQSVSTDEANIASNVQIANDTYSRDDIPTGETIILADALTSAGNAGVVIALQLTDDVGTSNTTILDPSNERFAGLVSVYGQDGSGNRFADLVHVARIGTQTTINSGDIAGSPAGRSYDNNGSEIQLAMGSDTYDVEAHTVYGGRTA